MLRLAYERGHEKLAGAVEKFRAENPWVENYALYMAVKASFNMVSWMEWPDEAIRMHTPEAVREYGARLRGDVDFYAFLQYLFYDQWQKLHSYAHDNGVQFIGDIPIYVAMDSADGGATRSSSSLTRTTRRSRSWACRPMHSRPTGSCGGNPLYDWDAMAADGYGWWIRRIDGAKKLYDIIRIDHFRGFDSYWAVPYGDKTAANGRWRPGPGMGLVGVLTSWFSDLRLIAEDLGYITPGVRKLLADSGLPGMKVMEFAFDAHGGVGLSAAPLRGTACAISARTTTTRCWAGWRQRGRMTAACRALHATSRRMRAGAGGLSARACPRRPTCL